MKSSVVGFNSIFEQEEKRISKLKDMSVEIIQVQEKKGKRMKKKPWWAHQVF